MVPSKVQLGPNRQGWKQRKKLFLGFGSAILLAGFSVFCFFSFSFLCFSPLVVSMCLVVMAPCSQCAGVPAQGGETGGEARGKS